MADMVPRDPDWRRDATRLCGAATLLLGIASGCRIGYEPVPLDGLGGGGFGSSDAGTSAGAGESGASAVSGASGTTSGGSTGLAGGSGRGGSSALGGEAGSSTGAAGKGAGATSNGGSATSGGNAGSGGTTGSSGIGGLSGNGGSAGNGGTTSAGTSGSGGFAGSGGTCGVSGCTCASFGGHSYWFCSTPAQRSDALTVCVGGGLSLARIDDSTENAWILSTALSLGMISPTTVPADLLFTGANDIATADNWQWADGTQFWSGSSTGSAANGLYSNWASSNPQSSTTRRCAGMFYDGHWQSRSCTALQPYVCESP